MRITVAEQDSDGNLGFRASSTGAGAFPMLKYAGNFVVLGGPRFRFSGKIFFPTRTA
jgi:hypothetical protein